MPTLRPSPSDFAKSDRFAGSSDSVVLAFLKSEALHSADFTIREGGVARLNAELARRVAGLVTEMCAAAHLKSKY